MKYSAIDLHSNNSVVVVTDAEDRVLAEKRLPNTLERIVEFLAPHRDELVGVVVESTYNWYWLVDGLMAAGYSVRLANTGAVKTYDGLKHSGDEADARHLAQLLRLGILPEGYICPPDKRALRDLARRRLQLARNRTQHILAIENQVTRQTGHGILSNAVKKLNAEAVDGWGWPVDVAASIKANVAIVQALNVEIERLESHLDAAITATPDWQLINTVPGIGRTLSRVILLEVGEIARFASAGKFASYARCVSSIRISNGKKKGEGNRKNGNKYLSWAFVEAAHFAARFYPEAKRFYQRKLAKANGAVATKALAHKLARAVYHILKTGQPFDMQRCFAGG